MFQVNNMKLRIGQSRDIHRLETNNRPLIIAGILLECDKGPVSHSDGDVVFHALSEALLGALAKGDLGTYFPDNDSRYLNFNSENILRYCDELVKKDGFEIVNIDINVILEKPKLKNHLFSMRENIARILALDIDQVSLKAQTNEKCGEVGQNLAIEATAIVLLKKD